MKYRPLTRGRIFLVALITFSFWVLAALLGLVYGSSDLGGLSLLHRLFASELTLTEEAILFQARLPRVVFAGLVGAALAVGGAVFQAVLRNPLADPYILGISGGAALGGTILLALGSLTLGSLVIGTSLAAFAGAMAALLIIFGVARWTPPGRGATFVLLLTGVIVNAFAASLIMFFQSVVSARKAQEILFYLMGSLAVEGTPPVVMIGAALAISIALIVIYGFARDLNALSLGEEEAAYLGVEVERVRRITVIVASFAVAIAVAFSGIIGFVGLVVPHAVRLVLGPDHRVLLVGSAFGGAAFLTAADIAARAAFPLLGTTLPVGVLTSMIGAPLFLYFLWRSLKETRQWH